MDGAGTALKKQLGLYASCHPAPAPYITRSLGTVLKKATAKFSESSERMQNRYVVGVCGQ